MENFKSQIVPLIRGSAVSLLILLVSGKISAEMTPVDGTSALTKSVPGFLIGIIFLLLPKLAISAHILWNLIKGRISDAIGASVTVGCVLFGFNLYQAAKISDLAERVGPTAPLSRGEHLALTTNVCHPHCIASLISAGFEVSTLDREWEGRGPIPATNLYTRVPINECLSNSKLEIDSDYLTKGHLSFCVTQTQIPTVEGTVAIWTEDVYQNSEDKITITKIRARRINGDIKEDLARWTKASISPANHTLMLNVSAQRIIEGDFESSNFLTKLTGIQRWTGIPRSPDYQTIKQYRLGLKLASDDSERLQNVGLTLISSALSDHNGPADKYLQGEVARMRRAGSENDQFTADRICADFKIRFSINSGCK
jgi:hypothetical protein